MVQIGKCGETVKCEDKRHRNDAVIGATPLLALPHLASPWPEAPTLELPLHCSTSPYLSYIVKHCQTFYLGKIIMWLVLPHILCNSLDMSSFPWSMRVICIFNFFVHSFTSFRCNIFSRVNFTGSKSVLRKQFSLCVNSTPHRLQNIKQKFLIE